MHRFIHQLILGLVVSVVWLPVGGSGAAEAQAPKVQCFMLELYYDSSNEDSLGIRKAFTDYGKEQAGVKLYFRDLNEEREDQEKFEKDEKRFQQVKDYFNLKEVTLPAVYGLKTFESGIESPEELKQKLDRMLTLTAYVRNGCPHCRAAKAFFRKYGSRYPALNIVYREVNTDRTASRDMNKLTSRYRQRAASLPVIHYCNGLTIGYNTDRTTGVKILKTLDYWSEGCTLEKKN